MLTLVNTNRMVPPIGPIGLDYVASSVKQAGLEVEILDLGLVDKPMEVMKKYFSIQNPELVGLSFRNADDCFWPSADWFVPELKRTIDTIRSMTNAIIVIGGVGYSIFAKSILEYTGADFGIRGDGEVAIIQLLQQLRNKRNFKEVPGLLWKNDGMIYNNLPSWPDPLTIKTERDFIDNQSYFKKGGQCGLETKRGCNRNCIYCADPLAKGIKPRLREPQEIVGEVQALLSQGIDVLHICDSEFNIPRNHAYAVCQELIRYSLGDKIRWYAYLAPTPFDEELAQKMAQAGCVGIDFTGDSASSLMLETYKQPHNKDDLASAVRICRDNNIAVMIDLLLGGPGETPQTAQETIDFIKKINPDRAGATLGMRIYPDTAMEKIVARETSEGNNHNIYRKYTGPINLLKPTFYITNTLGRQPAKLIKDLIDGDQRFFEPAIEIDNEVTTDKDTANYNYNENLPLIQAIEKGTRGAYWDILRKIQQS